MRAFGLVFMLSCLAIAVSCAAETKPGSARDSEQLTVPLPGSARTVSTVNRYDLNEADVVAKSAGASFNEEGLELPGGMFDGEPLSWAIFGVDAADAAPLRLDVFGRYADLWVGVADQEAGRWVWLADGLQTGALLDLTQYPGAKGPAGEVFVCVMVEGLQDASGVQLALVLDDDTAGDEEPPTWTEAEGVTSVSAEFESFLLEFGDADDAGSEPVQYLVYGAPSDFGIDWSRPLFATPEDGSFMVELYEFYDFTTIPMDFGIRAMDAAGNVTTNTNTLSGTLESDEGWEPLLGDWKPGDSLRLRWTDPQTNLRLLLTAPNYDEGDPEELTFRGRSFFPGPDSDVSGLAEEVVRFGPGPAGYYAISVLGDFPDSGFENYVLEVLYSDGTVKQVLGGGEIGGSLGVMMDVGFLRYNPTALPE
jgi:hypothetical protein